MHRMNQLFCLWREGSCIMKVNKSRNKFVSEKIRKLIEEGKPMKQAVAIALSMYERKNKR